MRTAKTIINIIEGYDRLCNKAKTMEEKKEYDSKKYKTLVGRIDELSKKIEDDEELSDYHDNRFIRKG